MQLCARKVNQKYLLLSHFELQSENKSQVIFKAIPTHIEVNKLSNFFLAVPICMPNDLADFTGRMATVTGWGRLKYGGGVPSVLQEVQVRVVSWWSASMA